MLIVFVSVWQKISEASMNTVDSFRYALSASGLKGELSGVSKHFILRSL